MSYRFPTIHLLPKHFRHQLVALMAGVVSIAVLGLALEDQFHRAILLDGWIAQHTEPSELTIGSLCTYLQLSP